MFQIIITKQRAEKDQIKACQPLPQARFLAPSKSPAPAVAINTLIVALPPKLWLLAVEGLQHALKQITVFYRKERHLTWLS